jgi:hypothetical protein
MGVEYIHTYRKHNPLRHTHTFPPRSLPTLQSPTHTTAAVLP